MPKGRESAKKTVETPDPKEILRERKLLIADLDPVHRAFLLKLASDVGFDTRKIFLAKDAEEALHFVKEEAVTTILYDDSLGIRTLEAIQECLAKEVSETVFVFLVSQNSSQAGVGRAVETDVDGFCLKPFSSDEFKAEFLAAFAEKVQPDEFRKVLNLGKSRLYEGDLDQAEKLFEKAKDLGAAPSSAHFYAGQVKLMKRLLEESRQEFMQGILLNQIHCKCLKAMFDLLHGQKKMEESYEVLRRLVGIFPDNVERLKLVIRMAVETGNFFDILTWYEVYEGQGDRDDEVKKHVCAALSIFGRYLLMTQKNDDAMKAFERALAVGVKKEVFLTYAAESLQKDGLGDEAMRLVKAHDPEFAEALAEPAPVLEEAKAA
jgi:DNA-binding NarL/FixJ family response regulator